MVKGPALVALCLLLAGCSGWPPVDADLRVYNETDQSATVEVTVVGEDGAEVVHETLTVGPQGTADGPRVKGPAGDYRVEAHSGAHHAEQTLSLGRETPAVKVYVRPGGLEVGASST